MVFIKNSGRQATIFYMLNSCCFYALCSALPSLSQWNGAKSVSGSFHDGLRIAYIIYGITTITMHPIISTEYQTVLLPVSICPGGMKLRIKARSEPQNPVAAIIHISALPLPNLKGRGADFIL